MDVEPTFAPFLTGFTYTKRRYTPDINTEADESIELDLTSKFGLLEVEEPKSAIIVDEFRCGIKGCKSTFTDVQAYEAHYNSAHKNVCQFCKKIYPTPFWLELHVLEHHDNYFKLLSARQNMYQCLVESCKEKFINEEKRKQHLIHVHAYPKSFDFQNLTARNIKRKPKKSSKEGAVDASKSPLAENKARQTKRPRNPFNKMDIEEDNLNINVADAQIETKDNSSNERMSTEQAETTKENNMKDNNEAPIPHNNNESKASESSSTRGSKQKNFSHRGRGRNNSKKHVINDKSHNIDTSDESAPMQVESSSQPQVVFKGSVPKTFHFGRGRGRGMRTKPATGLLQHSARGGSADADMNGSKDDIQMKS